ncbi:MAG: hypothetical protein GEV03_06240 [Streptosporangiales bacterium]|nr:hypothetical protein [Streptosporangiales bacterium]
MQPNHRCGVYSTRVTHPDPFAVAFARGVERPRMRPPLEMPCDPDVRPPAVSVPIADLLGPDGHRYCSGYWLLPMAGNMRVALAARDIWAHTRAAGQVPGVPEPEIERIPTFKGGTFRFYFLPNRDRSGYEVECMYPVPLAAVARRAGIPFVEPYWQDDPEAPFATLLRIVESHCHPETDEDAYSALRRRADRDDDAEMQVFKEELRQAVRDPALIPEDALFTAAEFGDGSDETFLRRLWRDLYGDEPV